jgi:hypothetical protein
MTWRMFMQPCTTHLGFRVNSALGAIVLRPDQCWAGAGRGPHGNGVAWGAAGIARPLGPLALHTVDRAVDVGAFDGLRQRPACLAVVERLRTQRCRSPFL